MKQSTKKILEVLVVYLILAIPLFIFESTFLLMWGATLSGLLLILYGFILLKKKDFFALKIYFYILIIFKLLSIIMRIFDKFI